MTMLAVLSLALSGHASFEGPVKTDFPWSKLWHGQSAVVGFLSHGRALEGYHFYEKYNRIQEAPWNSVQTCLGAYFVAKLDAVVAARPTPDRIEKSIVSEM